MKKYTFTLFSIMILPAVLIARPYGDCPYYGGHFFGGGLFMMILGLLLVIALLFFIFTIVKNQKSGKDLLFYKNNEDDPLQILKKRLARGEITEIEYEKLKEKLS